MSTIARILRRRMLYLSDMFCCSRLNPVRRIRARSERDWQLSDPCRCDVHLRQTEHLLWSVLILDESVMAYRQRNACDVNDD